MSEILNYITNKENAIYLLIYIIGFILVAVYYGLLSAVAMTALLVFIGIVYGLIIKLIYK